MAIRLLILGIICYCYADPATHLGSFFGNAIADWSGSVIIILGTKYLLEFHSAESRRVKGRPANPVLDFLWRHSLLLFIIVTASAGRFCSGGGCAKQAGSGGREHRVGMGADGRAGVPDQAAD